MKKLAIAFFVVLFAIAFAACSQGGDNSKAFELEGLGVDDLVSLELPEDYEETDLTQNGAGDTEILSRTWANEDSSVRLAMLSYDGKGILGMDGSVADYVSDYSPDAYFVSMNSPLTDAYVTLADGTSEDGDNIKDNTIEATFGCDKYVLGLEMENTREKSLAEEQKETFYTILKTISVKGR